MKILIYIAVFFVYSILKPFLDAYTYNQFSSSRLYASDDVALICGLVAAVFAVSAYFCAHWLCKLWDKHRAAKIQRGSLAETKPTPIKLNPEILDVEPAITASATPKLRRCKLCGDPIAPTTRKCTGCRKQYFRPPVLEKKHFAIATLVCVVVVILMFSLVIQKNAALSQVDELSSQVSEFEDTVSELERQINVYKSNESSLRSQLSQKEKSITELRDESAAYKEYLDYCEMYCAYLTINNKISGTTYHRLDCPYAKAAERLLILYIDFLEGQGYTPCPHCYK